MKTETILISSTQYPYYGGSATNAYALIKEFRRKGYKTAGLFINKKDENIEPDKIGGIFQLKDGDSPDIIKKRIDTYLGRIPSYIFAKNYVAPIVCKKMYISSKVAYLVAGCPQMMELSKNNISAIKYLNEKNIIIFQQEKDCFNIVDYVIPNSEIGKKLLIKHYGNNQKILEPINTSIII